MRKALLTAFEPFAGGTVNTSLWVLEALETLTEGRPDAPQMLMLPVVFDEAAALVLDTLDEEDFDEIILLGMAGQSDPVRIETQARNLDDSMTADNQGAVRHQHVIIPGGPEVLTPTYPRNNLLRFLHNHQIKAEMSDDAGRFLCNNTYFHVAEALIEGGDPFEAPPLVFIHLPAPRGGAKSPGWEREDALRFAQVLLHWLEAPW
ncbi:hypothetical protein HZA57_08295 [Candidatus Poribacteria bacterium]|nr:hypothetical protein [Candidatus Poribacteria bacterium]